MDISAIALQGLDQAQSQVEGAAARIVSAGSVDGANLDVVDLSAEIIALTSAKVDYSINLSVLKTADEVQKQTINLLA